MLFTFNLPTTPNYIRFREARSIVEGNGAGLRGVFDNGQSDTRTSLLCFGFVDEIDVFLGVKAIGHARAEDNFIVGFEIINQIVAEVFLGEEEAVVAGSLVAGFVESIVARAAEDGEVFGVVRDSNDILTCAAVYADEAFTGGHPIVICAAVHGDVLLAVAYDVITRAAVDYDVGAGCKFHHCLRPRRQKRYRR